jgi:hypothetical protein
VKKNIINDPANDVIPDVSEEQIIALNEQSQVVTSQDQSIDDMLIEDAIDEELGKSTADDEVLLQLLLEEAPTQSGDEGSSLNSIPLVNIDYGRAGAVDSLARDLAFNFAQLPAVEVKLTTPPLLDAKLPVPTANPYDGQIHELFLDARELIQIQAAFLLVQNNALPTPLPYPDASIEKFASPEGAAEGTDPIAIYGNYIEGFTSPGQGGGSVQIVSMTFNNHVYTPDANGKIMISTSDGQLVMYTKEAGLEHDFPGDHFTPGFFYYVESSNVNHAPGNGENLLDHNMLITIANSFGQTATAAFNIHIVDDVPIAHDDTVKLLQDLGLDGNNQIAALDVRPGLPVNQVSGNLLANDDFSVDNQNLVKQVIYQFDGSSHAVILSNGTNNFITDFGHFTIDPQGNYTYEITANLPNDHITEDLIQYQMIDKDGDPSSANWLMRMAPAPVVNIVPNEGDANGDGGLTVKEGMDTSVQYKIMVTGVLLEDLSFTASTQDDTAFANGNTPGTPDYVASSTVFTVPADGDAYHEVVLPPNTIVDDNIFENVPETFDTVLVPSGTISSDSNTSIPTTIIDDDPPPQVSIGSQLTVSEGNPGDSTHYATFIITMTGSSQDPVTFHYQTQDGTALGGTVPGAGNPDYVPTSGDITFPSFDGTQTFTIQVPIIDDFTYERLVNQQENFSINLTPVDMNGAQFGNSTAVVTITDDDVAPYVKILGGTISEGGGSFDAIVQLFGSSAEPISFSYATSDGTAVASGSGIGQPDYSATTGTFTFTPQAATGESALSQIFHIFIPITNDSTYEGTTPENFTITLATQGYVAGPPASLDVASSTLSATVNITDDALDVPSLVAGNNGVINVVENDVAGGVFIPITRIGGSTEAISFKLSSADISAVAGSDYGGLDPNTIYTIPASNGNATVNVFIPIVNDGVVEPNETFSVNITPVSGTLSGITNGVVTIINDDIGAQAVNDSQTINPSAFAAYNITLILDTSSSMSIPVDFSFGADTRLEVLQAALNDPGNLLDTYFALSNGLHVNIIQFNTQADFVSQTNVNDQNDLDSVKDDIDNLFPTDLTNYADALEKAIARFIIDDNNSGLDGYINRAYFISDGEPGGGLEGDITAWQAALLQYGVESFTANISAGSASNTYLDPIATQTHNPLTFTAANDLSNLDDFLLSTIAISGNVLANDIPGNFGASSVVSYLYNNGANVGTIGVSVDTALGGKFILYADGSYNYIPDGNNTVLEHEIFNYNILDGGGNASSAVLDLTMLAFLPPLVLDLNNDGNIELISAANSGISFDVNHDGTKEHIGWVSSNDGILVYDPTDSGQVTDINQIAFNSYVPGAKTDLEGLKYFDSNHDGQLDAADQAYSHFGVWQDSNSNGVVDQGEYQILDQAGIKSLSLTSDHNKESVSGNVITGHTSYQTSDGQSHLAADVSLSVGSSIPNQSANNSVNVNDVLPGSNGLDFSHLPESNNQSQAASLPALANDPAPAAVPAAPLIQEDVSIISALQQTQQEAAALHPA